MGKSVFIAEKPSVARQFADALKLNTTSKDGYLESNNCIITWCVGHLVTMSYPDAYDEKLKKWSLSTLPFLPDEYKYEVISSASKQYKIVSNILTRDDVDTIYVCTDSGREGEYIYRLVAKMANVKGKVQKRVWIDSQTDEAIRNGIKDAKDLSEYDSLADAAYLRAKEDYLMGINFSRALSLKYGNDIASNLGKDYSSIAVGRVMTCVLGMVVKREREIRDFTETPFFRIIANTELFGSVIKADWRAVEGTKYYMSPKLYKDNGFLLENDADDFITNVIEQSNYKGTIKSIEKKKESKNPPYLYNLTELSADCAKYFKISPQDTLNVAQELYEKKLTTYPRTGARVLSSAVAKEIYKNIAGLQNFPPVSDAAKEIITNKSYAGISKTKYVNDKLIEDHYAIIPTGQGLNAYNSLSDRSKKIYELIVRRFLSIFMPSAEYQKVALQLEFANELFFANFKVLTKEGFLAIAKPSYLVNKKNDSDATKANDSSAPEKDEDNPDNDNEEDQKVDLDFIDKLKSLKAGVEITAKEFVKKEGKTSPPKRYTTGTMLLAMENAGQLIEDEELRALIKGSGIGTPATRANILDKLEKKEYMNTNKKTQVISPTYMGEMIYDIVNYSIKPMLDPKFTASWEKGLTQVAEGEITADVYMQKLNDYVGKRTNILKDLTVNNALREMFRRTGQFYKKNTGNKGKTKNKA